MSKQRISQSVGAHGQRLALSVLDGLGIEQLHEIATPVTLSPYKQRGRIVKGVYYVRYKEKVTGDIRGILGSTGISVHAEVKTYTSEDRLLYSNLESHQHAALAEHDRLGGVSLLVWNHGLGVYVMRYPIAGFVPRSSITFERAIEIDEETREWIRDNVG